MSDSFEIRVKGHHVYVLDNVLAGNKVLSLEYILQEVKKKLAPAGTAQNAGRGTTDNPYVHIYCEDLKLESLDKDFLQLRWLRIIARSIRITPPTIADTVIDLKFPGISVLSLIATDLPENVQLYIGKTAPVPLLQDPSPSIGMHYHDGPSEKERRTPIYRIAPIELSKPNSRDVDTVFPNKRPRELYEFLVRLFNKATANERVWLGFKENIRPEKEISAFKLIAALTRDSLDQADLYQQAYSIWQQLEIPSRSGYYVPNIPPDSAKSVVKSWREAVTAINAEYTSKAFQDAVTKQIDKVSNEVVKQVYKSADKILTTITSINQDAADFSAASWATQLTDKTHAVEKARAGLDEIQDAVTTETDKFETSFKKWKEEQAEEARNQEIFFYLEIAIDIGMIFVEGPAALGGVKNLSKAASKFKTMQENIKKLDKMKKLMKLGSKLEKIHTVMGVAQKFTLSYFARGKDKPSNPTAEFRKRLEHCMNEVKNEDGFDWGEVKMMWDDFEIDNESMFVSLKDYDIGGKRDYEAIQKKLICRGRTLLIVQKEAQELRFKAAQAAAYQQLVESKAEDYQMPAPTEIITMQSVEFVKILLTEKLQSARRSLFLAIHEWVLIWAFENGRATLPKKARPRIDDSASDFVTAVADLEAETEKTALGAWQSPSEPLVLSTADEVSVFEERWKTMLESEGQVQFLVPFKYRNGQPYSYVKSAIVKIEGLGVFPTETEKPGGGKEMVPAITKDLLIRTEVEFGPILGQKNTKDDEFYSTP